jgi:hypothetical protein
MRVSFVGALVLSVLPWMASHGLLTDTSTYMVALAVLALYKVLQLTLLKPYVIDPAVVAEIGERASRLPTRQDKVAFIHAELARRYRGVAKRDEWIYYTGGGAIGGMDILFATPFEYIMINGSSLPFVGHTGRNAVAFSDTIIDGSALYTQEERPYEREEYGTGGYCYMPRWRSGITAVQDHLWLLEYARGHIWALMPMGMLPILHTTVRTCARTRRHARPVGLHRACVRDVQLDFSTMARTLWVYTKRNLQAMV